MSSIVADNQEYSGEGNAPSLWVLSSIEALILCCPLEEELKTQLIRSLDSLTVEEIDALRMKLEPIAIDPIIMGLRYGHKEITNHVRKLK